MKLKFKKTIHRNLGQGVMEYIILSSLIGIFCLVVIKQFGGVVQKRITSMKNQIVKNIPIN